MTSEDAAVAGGTRKKPSTKQSPCDASQVRGNRADGNVQHSIPEIWRLATSVELGKGASWGALSLQYL